MDHACGHHRLLRARRENRADGGEWDKTYAYFDRAWGNVLANLNKRFDTGPIDWTEWMETLRKAHEQPAAKK